MHFCAPRHASVCVRVCVQIHCGYEMACAVMLCGGVGWRLFGTCITVVIQSAREEVRQEKRKKKW